MSKSTYSGEIQHIVVLMFENRSYDNILGWLYDESNAEPYKIPPQGQAELNGLTGGSYTNPDPSNSGQTIPVANQTSRTQLGTSGATYAPTTIPIVDPGEVFADMAQQFLGLAATPTSNPYATISADTNWMQGFTTNFAAYGGTVPLIGKPKPPPSENVKDVMNYFTPKQVPMTSMLANKYAVCDTWFASMPTQTFPNRAFSISAAPGVLASNPPESWIDDKQYVAYGLLADTPNLFSVLDTVKPGGGDGPFWKVYFHDYSISREVVNYVDLAAKKSSTSDPNVNVATFDDSDYPGSAKPSWLGCKPTTFIDDVTNANGGSLPPFVLIEPRYSNDYAQEHGGASGLAANSNHPGGANYLGTGDLSSSNPPIDVAEGEALLAEVYTQLRESTYWESTLLIVTYDEPGGIFDHVPLETATPPGTLNVPTGVSNMPIQDIPSVTNAPDNIANGFNFNVFGGRVPTIIAGPFVTPGSSIPPVATASPPTPFDHTSIIATAWDIFGLSASGIDSLNERDAAAPSLVPFLSDTPVND